MCAVTRVFLSYASRDRGLVETIDGALVGAGITAVRWEVSSAQDWTFAAEQDFHAADVVVLLPPASSSSAWADVEAEFTLTRDLDRRGVELIPVQATRAELSPVMRERAFVDLSADSGIQTLITQIRTVSRIDFAAMSPRAFTELVADLLRALGFGLDDAGDRTDAGADLRATYRRLDPFGLPEAQVWLVETKLYAHERVSVETIRQFAGVLSQAPGGTHGLLVTNTQLTSVAEEYVGEVLRDVSLRVLDGVRLRRLLREFPAVAARHFDGGTKVASDANS